MDHLEAQDEPCDPQTRVGCAAFLFGISLAAIRSGDSLQLRHIHTIRALDTGSARASGRQSLLGLDRGQASAWNEESDDGPRARRV